tara:strand:+ start:2897 stop:4327 length:1431 start_codon:yes stop_codon:yes gene_type:complete
MLEVINFRKNRLSILMLKVRLRKILKKIYFRLPVFAQNIACSYFGFITNQRRYGPSFNSRIPEIIARKNYTNKELEEYKNTRLKAFISYCYENIPFYQKQFNNLGITSEMINTKEDLSLLPIINKQIVKENYELFINKNNSINKLISISTSGTTGTGLTFNTTLEAYREQWAIWWRYRNSHGINRKYWCAFFGGRAIIPINQRKPPYWRINYPGKEIRFSVYHMTPENLDLYIEQIIKRKIKWIHGNPSSIKLLAFRVIETNLMHALKIKYVSLGAENATDKDIKLISEAFGVLAIQHYGQSEAVANISQCIHGNLIVDEDFSIVEFIPISNSKSHKLIGTNFTNWSFPLIRYDTGDLINLNTSKKSCSCLGRQVKDIEGRKEDYIVLRNGAKITRLDIILKESTNVRCSQFIQDQAGRADLLIVAGENYCQEDENQIRNTASSLLGDTFIIKIKYVDKINLTKSGKLKFIVNNIN